MPTPALYPVTCALAKNCSLRSQSVIGGAAGHGARCSSVELKEGAGVLRTRLAVCAVRKTRAKDGMAHAPGQPQSYYQRWIHGPGATSECVLDAGGRWGSLEAQNDGRGLRSVVGRPANATHSCTYFGLGNLGKSMARAWTIRGEWNFSDGWEATIHDPRIGFLSINILTTASTQYRVDFSHQPFP
ncbi:hypothetical protein B0H13DRAFT_1854776 [Mycena leptocephala]|nr:hypothetical protein B0H13DRAFT_1854776 [Mycena leptocephala]